MDGLIQRMIRAAKLDVSLYEEVEADKTAMGQAMTVVVLSSVAAGLGNMTMGGLKGLVLITLIALIGWVVWAYLTYFIGTRLLPEPQTEADLGQLLRTIGFSSAPGLVRILGILPFLRNIVFLAAGIWMLWAMIIAVRQALDYRSTWRAVGVCLIGWLVQTAMLALFFSLVGHPTMMHHGGP
ncbi:Yip1 domain-containing protein [Desulfacinum hydrothermale DSM 13146]|uniref:Yip1 domain-containing protein n=2 Tax=Desulfacinum hydrothermale TaxID=109258 RepID=A0A1W1XFG0_9BACT|nr:Yip1 domain-containing protein [Desulfacinum hydrothermale DSM 13146]